MKTTFSKTPSAATPAQPQPSATGVSASITPTTSAAPQDVTSPVSGAPIPAAPNTETAVQPAAPRPFDDENIDATDIQIARINIAQKVGDLGEKFTAGSLVYDQSLVLIDAPLQNTVSKSVRFVVIGFQPKKFEEKVPYGTQGGDIFDSEKEVVDAGGTLDYEEAKTKQIPLFQRSATALLLIEKPEGIDELAFPHVIDGKPHALALFKMKGSLYTAGAKTLFTARKIGHLKSAGYRSGYWTFQTFLKKHMGGNSSFVPVLKPAGPTSEVLRKAVVELIGF